MLSCKDLIKDSFVAVNCEFSKKVVLRLKGRKILKSVYILCNFVGESESELERMRVVFS